MKYDKIEKIGNSLIQHGKSNDRIYLMKLGNDSPPEIIDELHQLAREKNYTKIFSKIPKRAYPEFKSRGFIKEAEIPGFYSNREDACFLSRFIEEERAELSRDEANTIKTNIQLAQEKSGNPKPVAKKAAYRIDILGPDQAVELAELYRAVFRTYPFPIYEPQYLKDTMEQNVIYFGLFHSGKLIAASSAEMDTAGRNAEMTDFATLPSERGNNISVRLLKAMEEEMHRQEIHTLYTIARAFSPGMNITFAKMEYEFAGTLVNNTNIAGQIESMNVWYKKTGTGLPADSRQ
jgi:putative beta-lysine N-acetyltransferase